MTDNIKIGFVGGDRRQLVAAERISEEYECAVWGFAGIYGSPDEKYLKNTIRCADAESAVRMSDAVVLPLPASRDGVRLNCPLAAGGGETPQIRLLSLCDVMKNGSLLIGGIIPPVVKKYAAERGITSIDYYDSEELQILNSVPTAEGAISAFVSELPVTVAASVITVTGYGRVGRTLAQRLKLLGANVVVAARSVRDLSYARCDGCTPVKLDEYRAHPIKSHAVFNTIPHMIFDRGVLSLLCPDTVIFELAGGDGGVDTAAAYELGIRVVPLNSLPGKTSPQTAGEIISSVIEGIFRDNLMNL